MKYIVLLLLFINLQIMALSSTFDIEGIWEMQDVYGAKYGVILYFYEYNDKYYAKLIALTYKNEIYETFKNPSIRNEKIKEPNFLAGLDIIWDLEKDSNQYINGRILNAQSKLADMYKLKITKKKDQLNLYAYLGIFGRSISCKKLESVEGLEESDFQNLIPNIPLR